ncbi:hypothetical protein ACFQY9_16210 [Microvirga aerilata]|uniref:hypothetical protein n=1 Tax=Microvirga aerilata TaxID=670292 RepID=UPI0036367ADC
MTETAPPAVAQSFLTVEVGDERFAFPAADVAEVIRPRRSPGFRSGRRASSAWPTCAAR